MADIIDLAAHRAQRQSQPAGREDAAYLDGIEDIVNDLLAYLEIDVEQAIAADHSTIRKSDYERLMFLGSRALDRVARDVNHKLYPGCGWTRPTFGDA